MAATLRLQGERDDCRVDVNDYTVLELRSSCEYFRSFLDFGGGAQATEQESGNGSDIALQVNTGACTAALAASVLHYLVRGAAAAPLEVDGANAAELLSLADLWCLADVKAHVLKSMRKSMCNSFRRPAVGSGAVETVPHVAALAHQALEYGIGDADGGLQRLYDDCITWMAAWPARAWPTRTFAGMQRSIQEDVLAAAKERVNADSAPAVMADCRRLSGMPSVAWARRVAELRSELTSYTMSYIWSNFTEVCVHAGARRDRAECWGALLEELRAHVAENPDPDAAVSALCRWSLTVNTLLYGKGAKRAAAGLAGDAWSTSPRAAGAEEGQQSSWLGDEDVAQLQDLYEHVRSYCVRHMPLVARCAAFRALPKAQQQLILQIGQEGIGVSAAAAWALTCPAAAGSPAAAGAVPGTPGLRQPGPPGLWGQAPSLQLQLSGASAAGTPDGVGSRISASWVISGPGTASSPSYMPSPPSSARTAGRRSDQRLRRATAPAAPMPPWNPFYSSSRPPPPQRSGAGAGAQGEPPASPAAGFRTGSAAGAAKDAVHAKSMSAGKSAGGASAAAGGSGPSKVGRTVKFADDLGGVGATSSSSASRRGGGAMARRRTADTIVSAAWAPVAKGQLASGGQSNGQLASAGSASAAVRGGPEVLAPPEAAIVEAPDEVAEEDEVAAEEHVLLYESEVGEPQEAVGGDCPAVAPWPFEGHQAQGEQEEEEQPESGGQDQGQAAREQESGEESEEQGADGGASAQPQLPPPPQRQNRPSLTQLQPQTKEEVGGDAQLLGPHGAAAEAAAGPEAPVAVEDWDGKAKQARGHPALELSFDEMIWNREEDESVVALAIATRRTSTSAAGAGAHKGGAESSPAPLPPPPPPGVEAGSPEEPSPVPVSAFGGLFGSDADGKGSEAISAPTAVLAEAAGGEAVEGLPQGVAVGLCAAVPVSGQQGCEGAAGDEAPPAGEVGDALEGLVAAAAAEGDGSEDVASWGLMCGGEGASSSPYEAQVTAFATALEPADSAGSGAEGRPGGGLGEAETTAALRSTQSSGGGSAADSASCTSDASLSSSLASSTAATASGADAAGAAAVTAAGDACDATASEAFTAAAAAAEAPCAADGCELASEAPAERTQIAAEEEEEEEEDAGAGAGAAITGCLVSSSPSNAQQLGRETPDKSGTPAVDAAVAAGCAKPAATASGSDRRGHSGAAAGAAASRAAKARPASGISSACAAAQKAQHRAAPAPAPSSSAKSLPVRRASGSGASPTPFALAGSSAVGGGAARAGGGARPGGKEAASTPASAPASAATGSAPRGKAADAAGAARGAPPAAATSGAVPKAAPAATARPASGCAARLVTRGAGTAAAESSKAPRAGHPRPGTPSREAASRSEAPSAARPSPASAHGPRIFSSRTAGAGGPAAAAAAAAAPAPALVAAPAGAQFTTPTRPMAPSAVRPASESGPRIVVSARPAAGVAAEDRSDADPATTGNVRQSNPKRSPGQVAAASAARPSSAQRRLGGAPLPQSSSLGRAVTAPEPEPKAPAEAAQAPAAAAGAVAADSVKAESAAPARAASGTTTRQPWKAATASAPVPPPSASSGASRRPVGAATVRRADAAPRGPAPTAAADATAVPSSAAAVGDSKSSAVSQRAAAVPRGGRPARPAGVDSGGGAVDTDGRRLRVQRV